MKLYISPYHRATLHATLCTNKHKAFCDNNKCANDFYQNYDRQIENTCNFVFKAVKFLKK